jgi:hypothetical protein
METGIHIVRNFARDLLFSKLLMIEPYGTTLRHHIYCHVSSNKSVKGSREVLLPAIDNRRPSGKDNDFRITHVKYAKMPREVAAGSLDDRPVPVTAPRNEERKGDASHARMIPSVLVLEAHMGSGPTNCASYLPAGWQRAHCCNQLFAGIHDFSLNPTNYQAFTRNSSRDWAMQTWFQRVGCEPLGEEDLHMLCLYSR